MNVERFVEFIAARELHRIAKERGWSATKAKPDPIISEYRFCNVRRNDDRVTKWIHQNLLEPLADDEYLWFYLVIARLFNKPATLEAFSYAQYKQWKPEVWRKRLKKMREAGPIFNAAYIVSTNGIATDKVDYLIDQVLSPLWKARKLITEMINEAKTLDEVHGTLMSAQGLGSFMAAQVIADLKYASPKSRWKDFDTFAASGPGSRRGMNRVLGGPVHRARPEYEFREKLDLLREMTNKLLKQRPTMKHLVPLTAQDVQNCLCEYDKYERARLGEGRPKQKYVAAELPWRE
jgi:hypothetical protein